MLERVWSNIAASTWLGEAKPELSVFTADKSPIVWVKLLAKPEVFPLN